MTIIDYLIVNQERYKEKWLTILKEKLDVHSNDIFRDDIIQDFEALVTLDIVNDVTKALACDSESVILVLEKMKIINYLKGEMNENRN